MKYKKGDKVRVKQNDQLINKELYYDSTSDMSMYWSTDMTRFIGKEFILNNHNKLVWCIARG